MQTGTQRLPSPKAKVLGSRLRGNDGQRGRIGSWLFPDRPCTVIRQAKLTDDNAACRWNHTAAAPLFVVPAQAGTQRLSSLKQKTLNSRLRGNDGQRGRIGSSLFPYRLCAVIQQARLIDGNAARGRSHIATASLFVVPVQAGTQRLHRWKQRRWVPACVGMTVNGVGSDSGCFLRLCTVIRQAKLIDGNAARGRSHTPPLSSTSSPRRRGPSDFRRRKQRRWVPAFAGMTVNGVGLDPRCFLIGRALSSDKPSLSTAMQRAETTPPPFPSSSSPRRRGPSDFHRCEKALYSRLRGNDGRRGWFPACAGNDGQRQPTTASILGHRKRRRRHRAGVGIASAGRWQSARSLSLPTCPAPPGRSPWRARRPRPGPWRSCPSGPATTASARPAAWRGRRRSSAATAGCPAGSWR